MRLLKAFGDAVIVVLAGIGLGVGFSYFPHWVMLTVNAIVVLAALTFYLYEGDD